MIEFFLQNRAADENFAKIRPQDGRKHGAIATHQQQRGSTRQSADRFIWRAVSGNAGTNSFERICSGENNGGVSQQRE